MLNEHMQGYISGEVRLCSAWPVLADFSIVRAPTEDSQIIEVVATSLGTFVCSATRNETTLRYETPRLMFPNPCSIRFAFTWGLSGFGGAVNGVVFGQNSPLEGEVIFMSDSPSNSKPIKDNALIAEGESMPRPVIIELADGAILPSVLGPWKMPARDFDEARACLGRMTEHGVDQVSFEQAFWGLTHRLNRGWVNLYAEGKDRFCEEFVKWASESLALKKNDPLLCYLDAVRDQGEHNGYRFGLVWPESSTQLLGTNGGIALQSLHRNPDGRWLAVAKTLTGEPADVTFKILPSVPSLPTLKNTNPRSNIEKVFDPPMKHLGAHLSNNDPITVATQGLAFYQKCLSEAITRFGQ